MVAFVMLSVIVYAFNDKSDANQGKKEVTGNGEVVVMDKEMFLKDVFDYEKSKEWKYKGDKPAIIDLYADWCGPCRQTAPIMKELAKEYAGKITIYKVNVDKQKELAALFNATSIPLQWNAFLCPKVRNQIVTKVRSEDQRLPSAPHIILLRRVSKKI